MTYPRQRQLRRSHVSRRGAFTLVLTALLAVVALGACASRPGKIQAPPEADGVKSAPLTAPDKAKDDLPPPEPQWRTGGEALGISEPARAPVPLGEGGGGFTPFSQDLADLRAEVAMICGSARINKEKEKDYLPTLVKDLYLSGVDPALATEALIQSDCASLASVVREMIAQGGEESVAAVVGRALFLSGPGAERTIESAASAGLERNLGSYSQIPSSAPIAPAASGSLSVAMAYFPSRAESPGLATAKAVDTLYSNATPGYGIYTFVLLGAAFDPTSQPDVSRYAELLRVIETYVLAADQGTRGPSPESHAFLVAVQSGRGDVPLIEQTGPKLSDPMRLELARYLRQQGQTALAGRLDDRPGPFLISSLEPRLMPTSRVSPRLIVDLSTIGPEYMYAVVDAFDQPIPAEQSGRPGSLTPIRDRLLGLFNRRVPEYDLEPTIKDAWVFRLGGPSPGQAADAAGSGEASVQPGAPAAADQARPAVDAKPAESSSKGAAQPQTQPQIEPRAQSKQPSETPTP